MPAKSYSRPREKHGHSRKGHRTRIYEEWVNMRQRCRNPKNPGFEYWGGRGITMCERWEWFTNFLADMGPGKKGWTVERIDNNQSYCLENCCWATLLHQAGNTRKNVYFTIQGVTGCMAELCRHFKIDISTVFNRLYRSHWTPEKSFLTPPR